LATASCTVRDGICEIAPAEYITDVNYFGEIAGLFVEVAKILSCYELSVTHKSIMVPLQETLICDISYDIFVRKVLTEQISLLQERKSYDVIIFGTDSVVFSDISLALVNKGMNVHYKSVSRPDGVLSRLRERLMFIFKGIAFTVLLRNRNNGLPSSILTYFSAYYYAEKSNKGLFRQTVIGVTSKEQMKSKSFYPVVSLIHPFAGLKYLVTVSSTKRTPPESDISLFVSRLLPKYYFRAQLMSYSYLKTLVRNSFRHLVVTMPSFIDSATLVECAKALGINTVLVHGGALTTPEQYLHPRVDRYLVWGKYYKEMLLSLGVPEGKVTVYGSSSYSDIPLVTEHRSRVTTIGIVSTGFEHGMGNAYWKMIAEGVKGLDPSLRIVIRLHPLENAADSKSMIKEWFNDSAYEYDGQGTIKEFIQRCDLIIHQCSTAGIESIMMGVPSIDIDPFSMNKNAPYHIFSLPLKVSTAAEFRQALALFIDRTDWHTAFIRERALFLNELYETPNGTERQSIHELLSSAPYERTFVH
ncbi:MAG: hypothetical protein ACOYNS_17695, partial [Bacteroidota bacterium]